MTHGVSASWAETVANEVKKSQREPFMGSPSDGRRHSRERERESTGRNGSRRKTGAWGRRGEGEGQGGGEERGRGRGGRGGRGGGCVEQREHWEDPLSTQPDRENELCLTERSEECAWELYPVSNPSSHHVPSTRTVGTRSQKPVKYGN